MTKDNKRCLHSIVKPIKLKGYGNRKWWACSCGQLFIKFLDPSFIRVSKNRGRNN